MCLSETLREARLEAGFTLEGFGKMVGYSRSMMGAVETGERAIAPDVLANAADILDSPWLYMEAPAEVNGVVFVTPRLNGENIDLHRSSALAKAIEELKEAIEALLSLDLINKPNPNNKDLLAQVREVISQLLDVRVAVDHLIAILCKEFCISIKEVFKAHWDKLLKRGYIKKDRPARRS